MSNNNTNNNNNNEDNNVGFWKGISILFGMFGKSCVALDKAADNVIKVMDTVNDGIDIANKQVKEALDDIKPLETTKKSSDKTEG